MSSNTNKNIISLVQFIPKKGVGEEEMLAAVDAAQETFFALQPGVIDHKVLRTDGLWFDMILWDSLEANTESNKSFSEHEAGKKLHELADIKQVDRPVVKRAYC
ncbi:hypothetical protein KTR10_01195 [Candidatus Kaiserbacteria bacterium]|nr:hypothetical protein [Candidatus Kaiserbacteria bacterium]